MAARTVRTVPVQKSTQPGTNARTQHGSDDYGRACPDTMYILPLRVPLTPLQADVTR
jgi:hypothetical protein